MNRCNVQQQEDLHKWPHLQHVYLPKTDTDVELLIGRNVPRALEPLEVIRSVKEGPYAIKTMLGWTVNGHLGGNVVMDLMCISLQLLATEFLL